MDKAHAHVELKANCRALRFPRRPSPRGTETALNSDSGSLFHHENARHAATNPRLDPGICVTNCHAVHPRKSAWIFQAPTRKRFFSGLPEEHLRATNWNVGVLADPSANLLVVDSGTSTCSLKHLCVPRGEGLQSTAISETLPPHLSGLQQTAVPALVRHGVVIEHERPLGVSGAQASHVVADARLQEIPQFLVLVIKEGEQCAKRNSVLPLRACLDTGLGSIDDTGVADLCAAQKATAPGGCTQ